MIYCKNCNWATKSSTANKCQRCGSTKLRKLNEALKGGYKEAKESLGPLKPILSKTKLNTLSHKLRRAAKNYYNEGIKMYVDDLKDLNRIADLIQKGNLDKAYDLANDIDTSCQDEIPVDIFDFMQDTTETGYIIKPEKKSK